MGGGTGSEDMDQLQQEIEAATAAIARAAALVKGGVVGTVEMCASLETLDDAVDELQFEIERQLAPPGTTMSRSRGRSHSYHAKPTKKE